MSSYVIITFDGQRYPVNGRLEVGRKVSQGINLNDQRASRHHATIQCQKNVLFVIDEGSANGTFVNGVRIETQVLKAGDEIRIGSSVLKVALGADSTSANNPTTALAQKKAVPLWSVVAGALAVLAISGVAGIIVLLSLGVLGGRVSESVVALAYNMDGLSPLLTVYAAEPDSEGFWLPMGRYYIEAVDQNGLVMAKSNVVILDRGDGGDMYEFPRRFSQAGGAANAMQQAEIEALAKLLMLKGQAELTYLEIVSNGYKVPAYGMQEDIEMAALDPLLDLYDAMADTEDEVTAAAQAFEARASLSSATVPASMLVASAELQGGNELELARKLGSFFGFINDSDQRAINHIVSVSQQMSANDRADAFGVLEAAQQAGANNYDEWLALLQAGQVPYPNRARRDLYNSFAFQARAQNLDDTNRPCLNTAHVEGSGLVRRGADLNVAVVKSVLSAQFKGIDKGFDYADKANNFAEWARTAYRDPLSALGQSARWEVELRIQDQLGQQIRRLYPDISEEMLDILTGKIASEIVQAAAPPQGESQQGEETGPGPDDATSKPQPSATPVPTATPAPTVTPTPPPSKDWIEPYIQQAGIDLRAANYDPVLVDETLAAMRSCLIDAVDGGAEQYDALEACADILDALLDMPTMTPEPRNWNGAWNSGIVCDESDETAPYTWGLVLNQDGTQVTGYLYYHKCPDGGRAYYDVSGTATEQSTINLYAVYTGGRGPLSQTAARAFNLNFNADGSISSP